ncbi:MAG: OadG family transporter subunit [Eubacteriales bacterium]|nr:OadG family transporter subunit [Eubacteriales bacterium]
MTGKLRKVFLGLGLAGCLTAMSAGSVFAETMTETETVSASETEAAGAELDVAAIECEDEDLSKQLKNTLAYSSEGFLNTVIGYSEEELNNTIENGSEFEAAIAGAWADQKEDLGKIVEIKQHSISENNHIYTVVTTVQFENKDADLSVTYDEDLQPIDAVLDVEKSLAQNMQEAGMNFILGIGTVFIVLIFLSFVIGLLKPVSEMIEGKNKKQPVPAEPAVPVIPTVEEEEEELVDDLELVAVITAAIAASENTSSDGFVVRSIKRANNRKWQKA